MQLDISCIDRARLQAVLSSAAMVSPNPITTCLPASGANANQAELPDNAMVLPPTLQLQALLTIIRDEGTQRYVISTHTEERTG